MIRTHKRTENFHVSYNATMVTQANITETRCVIPWLYRRTTTEFHTTLTGPHATESSLRVERKNGGARSEAEPPRLSAPVAKRLRDLPLLLCPDSCHGQLLTSPAKEAVCTGATWSSAGALLGLGAWALAGPAGGALSWALGGGVLAGGAMGLVQTSVVLDSNSARRFAERCNAFLVEARQQGLSVGAVLLLEAASKDADGEQQQALVRDIATLCLQFYGGQINERARAILHEMAPQVDLAQCLGIEATRLPLGIADNQPQAGQRRHSF